MGEKRSKTATSKQRRPPPPLSERIKRLAKDRGLDVNVTDTDDGDVKVTMDTAAGRTTMKIGSTAKNSPKSNKVRLK